VDSHPPNTSPSPSWPARQAVAEGAGSAPRRSDPDRSAPQITLPKGGGAIKGIGEKFSANAFTGTAGLTVPLALSAGRPGGTPDVALRYDSGAGNGPFGLGWKLALPSISRKTEKGLPRYEDGPDSDVFILSDTEDLVPGLIAQGAGWVPDVRDQPPFRITRYRPRVEGAFARIERWSDTSSGDIHWRVTTSDNRTSFFGFTSAARIFDPAHPGRVFSWLLEESFDDRGNVVAFEYKPEDGLGVDPALISESGRLTAQRYLKRIHYGNVAPSDTTAWLFEAVFDYGEHDPAAPTPNEANSWPVRLDPFSTYRPGFEVRTRRLCRRLLMFHSFPELGPQPVLVRSTDLSYAEDPGLTLLTRIEQRGYIRDGIGYKTKALPAIDLTYTRPNFDGVVREVDPESLANLPTGADGSAYRWLDLDGDGLPGILTQQVDSWFYKRNLGTGRFAPVEVLPSRPSGSNLGSAGQRVTDLGGGGRQALVELADPLAGYYERTEDSSWTPFTPFRQLPNLDWGNPNLRMVDIDGDGLADVLVTEDEAITWFPSLGRNGYGAPTRLPSALDEEMGPALVFADGTESIFLADMAGDGLSDLVRIRNGDVVYWPNLGRGRFGSRVTMALAPLFDSPDDFEQRRLRLADLDGTGTTDLVYLGARGVTAWRNLAGNAWSPALTVAPAPPVDDLARITVADLLGSGTACLVWSSPEGVADAGMRYLDLVGGIKPNLLASIANHQGGTTTIGYAPSTKFFLADRLAAAPWATRLPFPVHVVEFTTVSDGVTGAVYFTRYRYHHGFFDGTEREFRGFGSVEQLDTDITGAALGLGAYTELPQINGSEFVLPPVLTRTWFHVGAFFEEGRLEGRFASEFYGGDPLAPSLAPGGLPAGLTAGEEQEAVRALRGGTLRTEVYALDGTAKASSPYLVTQSAAGVRLLQPRAGNRNACFLRVDRETLAHHYERNPADPRVTHQLTLEADAFGQVTRAASAAYPRRAAEIPEQGTTLVTYQESDLINHAGDPAFYRLGVMAEGRTYELTAVAPAGTVFTVEELRAGVAASVDIPFEASPAPPLVQRRLIRRDRTLYYKDDLSGPLVLGQIESHALPFETYRLAFTPSLLAARFGGLATPALLTGEGGYVAMGGDLWAPSGHRVHDPAAFFQPTGHVDPFGSTVNAVFDAHKLALIQTTDALGNTITSELNYRTLLPWRLVDPNGNRTGARFDECGWVVATAVMGKVDGDADRLDLGTPEAAPGDDPTTRVEYRLDQWAVGRPNFVHTQQRERHGDPATPFRETYLYTDGLGREALTKAQADPGNAPARDASGAVLCNPDGSLVIAHTDQRWVGSGRTVFDNKGNPVKKYEPFFDSLPIYENDDALRNWGVASVIRHDPLGRAIRSDLPDGSYTKVVFDPWTAATWDAGDTVLDSRWYADRAALPAADPRRRAADAAVAYAGTPAVAKLDVLGRTVRSTGDLGGGALLETRTRLDILGNRLSVIDPLGITVLRADYDLLARAAHTVSADSGERFSLADVLDRPERTADSRGHLFRWAYDALGRRTHLFVLTSPAPEQLIERTVYGEANPAAIALNLRTRPHLAYDGAGLTSSDGYDLDGNLAAGTRRLPLDPTAAPDWTALALLQNLGAIQAAANPTLEIETFNSATTFDALARPVTLTTPDASVSTVGYGRSGRLNTVSGRVRGGPVTGFVTSVGYNARGQRESIVYGNGTATAQVYDPLTFRLAQLTTIRTAPAATIQDLRYTFDPLGNVTEVADVAQQTLFFNNAMVVSDQHFTYDALYRLVGAAGREHIGQGANPLPDEYDWADGLRVNLPQPGDGNAMRRYQEAYALDGAGNLTRWQHSAAPSGSWTRRCAYDAGSHRLLSTSLPGDGLNPPYSGVYTYDPHGNPSAMPFLARLAWNALDRLESIELGGGGTAYYQYDAQGQRARKFIARVGGLVEERIYLGAYEVHRRRAATLELERQSLHVLDGSRRIAIVETKTVDVGAPPGVPASLTRYQFDNHLGSACVELDGAGAVVSYEEYYPFGSTSYQAGPASTDYSLKRYRYTGVERDQETGLTYHAARYCAPWLGRWISPDPAGLADGVNLYSYVSNNPLRLSDRTGTQGDDEPLGGTQYVPRLSPDPNLRLNPPNFWYSSWSQGSGVRELPGLPAYSLPGLFDVEAFLNPVGSSFRGLGPSHIGGGLSQGGLSLRYSLPHTGNVDIGGTVAGGYTSDGATGGAVATRGLTYLGVAHTGFRIAGPFTGGLYVAGGGVTQQASEPGQPVGKGPVGTAGTVSATGVIGYEPADDPPKQFTLKDLREPAPSYFKPGVSVVLNPTASYTESGSFSQGPSLRNLWTAGGILGVGLTFGGADFGSSVVITTEGGYLRSGGTADTNASVSSDTLRAGVVGTYNWIDRGAHGTSSVSFGAWYVGERGHVGGGGSFSTDSILFGATFGFRRIPLLGN
jgi:RHS repeat-associated protein